MYHLYQCRKFCILHKEHIYVFHMILRINYKYIIQLISGTGKQPLCYEVGTEFLNILQ
jgi:hypothetical protein